MVPPSPTPLDSTSTPDNRYIIEPANWRDLGSLRTLEQVCFPKDAWPLWDLIGALTFPNMVRLKAVSGDEMVGFIAVDLRQRERVAWIATVCVLPEFRRMGIGRALMVATEHQIPFNTIRLCVRVSNLAAQLLYRQLGYYTYEIWREYYRDREDALVMEKIRAAGGNGL